MAIRVLFETVQGKYELGLLDFERLKTAAARHYGYAEIYGRSDRGAGCTWGASTPPPSLEELAERYVNEGHLPAFLADETKGAPSTYHVQVLDRSASGKTPVIHVDLSVDRTGGRIMVYDAKTTPKDHLNG